MIIKPKMRGFISTTAHPEGCFKNVEEQVAYVKAHPNFEGPKNVLILGASTGYGLATRIAATFGAGAKTIGVFYERGAEGKRTASAGWYNTAAFETLAKKEGLYARSINGDAFSNQIKEQTVKAIREDLGPIDLIVYSLAAPRRTNPNNGETYNSVLKPIGQPYTNKTVDPMTGVVKEITIEPAEQKDIDNTVQVMGGEDWEMWIDLLSEEGLLADNVTTMAYTYIGPSVTHPIYKKGTIGAAKDHLQATADKLNKQLQERGGQAFLSVNKALVTQASAAIPVVPLYMSILFKLMKEKGNHEGCIEQIYRLLTQHLYADIPLPRDEANRIRVDDWEMEPDIQDAIVQKWPQVTTENIETETDIQGYRDEFNKLFGFGFEDINYDADVDQNIAIDSIKE